MASSPRQSAPIQPVVTFIVIITFGIILAVGINNNENYRLPIILASFLIGFLIAALELRTLVRTSRQITDNDESKLTRDQKVARYVAEMFNEDIPFDEFQDANDQKDNI